MRITVVTSYFPTSSRRYNGTSAVQTLRSLARYADIRVICPIARYPRVKWLSPPGYDLANPRERVSEFDTTYFNYPAVALLTRPVNGFTCTARLLPLVRAAKPDVILNYWLYPDGYSAVRVGRRLGVPVVVGTIGSDLLTRNDVVTRYLVRRTLRTADAVIAVSDDLRRRALDEDGSPGKISTIRNGCDHRVFHEGDQSDARRALQLPDGDEVILYVGALTRSKGLGELTTAFIELAKTRPTARLVLVGQGVYGDTVRQRLLAAGLDNRLVMPGYHTAARVAQWMRAADVLCLPSYSEGCPNVVIEALACGRPVVATNVGGTSELIDPTGGLLVPPRDPVQLRDALDRALDTSWDSGTIARTSSRSWDQVADETLAVCRTVLGRHPLVAHRLHVPSNDIDVPEARC
jgi:glycosyltransferase involved in cell wall biosynthesis